MYIHHTLPAKLAKLCRRSMKSLANLNGVVRREKYFLHGGGKEKIENLARAARRERRGKEKNFNDSWKFLLPQQPGWTA